MRFLSPLMLKFIIVGFFTTTQPAIQPAADEIATTRTHLSSDQQATRVDTVERSEIERGVLATPGTIMGALDQLNGARVQVTSPELGLAEVRIHGMRGQYTRLLSDGVALYHDLSEGLALPQIAPADVDRMEVVTGGASALFGANAINVVNLLSRRPDTEREGQILFNQSSLGGTDGVFWMSLPPSGSWSSTWLVSTHRQEEKDVDKDGWSDVPGYRRAVVHPRVFWNNGNGKSAYGTANVTFEKREGGSAFARQQLESRSADGMLAGQMPFHGAILQGNASLYAQSRVRKFTDGRQQERREAATIEMTLRGTAERQVWAAGLVEDWFTIRSKDQIWAKYTAPRTGLFVHDDLQATPWLFLSGSARVDHRVTYPITFSPRGSIRVRKSGWTAGASFDRSYFEPTAITEETEAAGVLLLNVNVPHLDAEHVRSVSADVAHDSRTATVRFTWFQSHIDHPVLVDRATFTLFTSDQPYLADGIEILGRVQRSVLSVTGGYTYARATEEGGRDVALQPRHTLAFTAMVEKTGRGRAGLRVAFTGRQHLDDNPYRVTSEPYTVVSFLAEHQFGRLSVFANAENLTDVRQTKWDPLARPSQNAVDGRWTVDAWAPLAGRSINAGIKVSF